MNQLTIFWRYFRPVVISISLIILAATFYIPRYVTELATQHAIDDSKIQAKQYELLRAYYTDNVVAKVLEQSNLSVSFDHLQHQSTIPLPASFIHDLSESFSQLPVKVKLYSPYPFPNRNNEQLDEFQQSAWQTLSNKPDEIATKVEMIGEQTFVRVAIADPMKREACVDCHNSYPNSPKTDWQLGDVRGVLEVTRNITADLEEGTSFAIKLVVTLMLILTLVALILVVVARNVYANLIRQNQLNQQLNDNNRTLSELNMQLSDTNELLIESEKMSALGGLVAGVSHELSTPIGICVTAASSLSDKITQLDDDLTAESLSKKNLVQFIGAAQELNTITVHNISRASELLNSFKLVAVDQSHDLLQTIDFHLYLDTILLSLSPKFKCNNYQVKVTSSGDWQVTTYPGSWAQVFTNLITNSLLHGFADSKDGEIHISAALEQGGLIVNYQDNGVGMNDEQLKKIYQPFFTTKRGEGGTGLGMHICLI